MVIVTSDEWIQVCKSYGLQVLRFTNLMVGSHSCEWACHPVLSSWDRINIMITIQPKCNTLWWFNVGRHTWCQTPLCYMNYLRYNFIKLPATPLDVDTRLQSCHFLSIPVGQLTVITLSVRGWSQNPRTNNQTTTFQVLTYLQKGTDSSFGYIASSL